MAKGSASEGYLAIVLHAHLPFVRHPEYENFLEERWFFEAMTETYIPLIKLLGRAASENVGFKLAISLSPTLLAMMEDTLLQERYVKHLDKLIELSSREQERNRNNPHCRWLAEVYGGLFKEARDIFTGCNCRLSAPFKQLHAAGFVELITTSATHGVLPFLITQPKAAHAQIAEGVAYFESVFGFRPQGFWLPECAFSPGLDALLAKEGIRYFFVESHGIFNAVPAPRYGVNAPIYTASGVAAFGRDQLSTEEVWSARKGYPGDPAYREFYRDIGHDLDLDYIRPYIAGDVRVDTGIKYYRITGKGSHKELYHPDAAREKAAQHAGNFLHKRIGHIEHLHSRMGRPPIIVAPFDAELFGHWWFEGPQWLDFLIRKTVYDQNTIELTTPAAFLDRHPVHQAGVPSVSTWGHKGYFEVWLNGKNDWIYPHLFECARRMQNIVNGAAPTPSAIIKRALNQCARELLLAQSSDWPFIINGGTATAYATRRFKDHVSRFHFLADAIENKSISPDHLQVIEHIDNIFPDIDYRVFIKS
ncbi:MAG: 1,4-alpha-glucan branching protein domain-containing protein [Chitinivibrionales bacterium]